MEKVTMMVSSSSEQLASTAEQMTGQIQTLVDLVNTFKLEKQLKVLFPYPELFSNRAAQKEDRV